jgi:hypothetical protein
MRKVALLCVATLVGALGITAAAFAINGTQTISVKTTANRAGSKSKPRSVGRITVITATTPAATDAPFATSRAVIHFDKNLVFGNSKFATCRQSVVQSNPTSCPAGSRVGSGTAVARLSTGGQVSPTITAYNGPRTASGNGKLFLLVKEPTFNVNAVLDGTLKSDTGKYGRKLDVLIPQNLQNVAGIVITLTNFTTRVGGTAKGTPYVGLRGCSGGKLSYKGDFFYTDNTTKSATTTSNCRSS